METGLAIAGLTLGGASSFSPYSSYGVGVVMVPTLQMEKWRLRDVK